MRSLPRSSGRIDLATDLQIAMRKISSVNPATGEVLRELECASES